MTISYYLHAWQGLLMFLAGLAGILASFAGYIQSGGGEELLHRSLAQFSSGKARFDSIEFKWLDGEMIVRNLRHEPFDWPKEKRVASFSGLAADTMTIRMDLLPWPPKVESITVMGMPDLTIRADEGFLQSDSLQGRKPPEQFPRTQFVGCNIKFIVGNLHPIELTDCSGELRRDATGNLRGGFSLRQLNGRPFHFKLESLEDGRWVISGDQIQLATREALPPIKPFPERLDPVSLLIKALFSGEMGAKGTVSALNIVVQPATETRKFTCDGEVGYSNLNFNLPPAEKEAGEVLPFFLDVFLGADPAHGESLWPRWMQVDAIRTGPHGRVTFHMADGRLDFSSDEGAEGAFTGARQEKLFPPLESLKGSVETDAEGRPRRVILRGFLGDQLSFETRMERSPDQSRTYQLLLEPRAGNAAQIAFNRPLWRLASRVTDYVSQPSRGNPAKEPLMKFQIEGNAEQFPLPEFLPPGIKALSGRLYLSCSLSRDLHLSMRVQADGASAQFDPAAGKTVENPVWALLGSAAATRPWGLEHFSAAGEVTANFQTPFQWTDTNWSDWKVRGGTLICSRSAVDLTELQLGFGGRLSQSETPGRVTLNTGVYAAAGWRINLNGEWQSDHGRITSGTATCSEQAAPLAIYPDANPQTGDRVNRQTIVSFDGHALKTVVKP